MGKKKQKKGQKSGAYAADANALPQAFAAFQQQLAKGGTPGGWLSGLPGTWSGRKGQQFLIGALVGAAAAYVMTDEALRGKLIKTGMKLYSGLLGGYEEMKEQLADLKAEAETERHG